MEDQQFLDYDGLAAFKEFLNGVEIVTAKGDGTAYTATIPNLTTLKKGLVITIIPDTTSAATIPLLNVNGLGAKNIKQRLSTNTSLTAEAATDSWMVANKPVPLMFDGTQWVTLTGRPSATAIYGVVPIKNGGTGGSTAEEARINLGVGGSNLYVNAPSGVTVTATKGETTYTRTADSDGLAIFESLAVGTWTVQITDGVDTSTREVVVKPDYSVTMAFFEATINITYPAGSTCTCTDGATTMTAPSTSGTWACIVPNAGTWTVSCTDNVQSDSQRVNITTEGQSQTIRLNYAVTDYPTEAALLADTPKENTIGIVTENGITRVERSTTETSSPVHGMVWIGTNYDDDPLFAKQYIRSAWVGVTAKIFQVGAWVDFPLYLFNNGDECEVITGGWTTKKWPLHSNQVSGTPTFVINDTNMVITHTQSSANTVTTGATIPIMDTDLTDVKTIELEMESVVLSGSGGTPNPTWEVVLFAQKRSASQCSGVATAHFTKTEAGTFQDVTLTLDVSNLEGEYCVGINTYTYTSDYNGKIVAAVNSVRCDK